MTGTTVCVIKLFLSTPSARRATLVDYAAVCVPLFLSTPSARRATLAFSLLPRSHDISIHAP